MKSAYGKQKSAAKSSRSASESHESKARSYSAGSRSRSSGPRTDDRQSPYPARKSASPDSDKRGSFPERKFRKKPESEHADESAPVKRTHRYERGDREERHDEHKSTRTYHHDKHTVHREDQDVHHSDREFQHTERKTRNHEWNNRPDHYKRNREEPRERDDFAEQPKQSSRPAPDYPATPAPAPENCIYGIHAVEELLNTRLTAIDHIYFAKEKQSQELFNLMKQCRKERLAYNLVPELRLDHFCHSTHHQGVVALCSVKEYCSTEELKSNVLEKPDALLLLPASVEDPGNLGAMIRSSVAFNVDAMILERKNTAPLNASVAKSAAGMIEHVTIARPKNIEALIEEFKAKNFSIIGADASKGVPPDQLDLKGPVLFVLGGEHRGIPPYLDKACTSFVSIPISSTVQSLNVSVAAAVLLYECNRQRNTVSKE